MKSNSMDLRDESYTYNKSDDEESLEAKDFDKSINKSTVRRQKNIFFITAAQIASTILWYWTNGMNGINMQKYSTEINSKWVGTKPILRFIETLVCTSLVTSLQLLAGAVIGRILLLWINPKVTWSQITSAQHWVVSTLHLTGSLATNMGFMYGKASMIQVLKLLEPFETLGLSFFFFNEGNITTGTLSSMVVVVAAAMSLLKTSSTKTPSIAIIFAILSGLSLSTRNVLQRKHHQTSDAIKDLNKLERSIVQFTQLSFYSGIRLGVISLVQLVTIQPILYRPEIQVILWHPLYNVFSMIILGLVSALTHSLLNAGKRVFSIIIAVLWFHEGINSKLIVGLLFVGIGGSWYSYESKQKEREGTKQYPKVILSLLALSFLAWHQIILP